MADDGPTTDEPTAGDVLLKEGLEPKSDILAEALANTSSNTKPRKKTVNRGALAPSMQRSQFGNQVDSGKSSAPSYGFGSAVRFDPKRPATKQFISKEHSQQELGLETPGPGRYQHISSLDQQELSTQRSSAKFGFGTAVRFAEERRTQKMLTELPAPGRYESKSSIGLQHQSTKESNTIVGFGTAVREQKVSLSKGFEEDFFGLESPGPAVYNPISGVGEQPSSGKTTSAHFVFGTNPRAIDPMLPNEHERRSAQVPGPGKYTRQSAIGLQVDSTKQSLPMHGFGTCDRDRAAKASLGPLQANTALAGYISPGPAQLGPGTSSIQAQPQSHKVNKPTFSFGRESRFLPNKSSSALAPGPGSYCT